MKNSIFAVLQHNLLKNGFFQSILKAFSKLFLVIDSNSSEKRAVITIDAESGFLGKKNERVWMKDDPSAYIGYTAGIRNILGLGEKHDVRFTFLVSTQCFSAENSKAQEICSILKEAYARGHEIGLHLHPKEDSYLQKILGRELEYTASSFYSEEQISSMVSASKKALADFLGEEIGGKIKSFRWANWALDERVFGILEKNGFAVDSSMCPGVKGHINDDRRYDWTNIRTNHPFSINNNLIEVPITTFWFFGKKRTDPVWGELLLECTRRANQIVVVTHSSECTYQDGKPTYVLDNLERFIETAKKNDFHFMTLGEVLARGI